MTILFFFLLSLLSVLAVWLMRSYALKAQLLDIPNQRSSHLVPTPRGGGVVIVIFFLMGGFLLTLFDHLHMKLFIGGGLCSLPVALIGYLDDHRNVSAVFRLAVHFAAAAALVCYFKVDLFIPWFASEQLGRLAGQITAVFFLVWFLNLFNFMDGIDGLAGMEALFVALGAAIILSMHGEDLGVVHWLLVLSAATCGFLAWNWPPAKIFMGDVGSGFIGFVFGWLTLLTSADGFITIWMWLILCGVFVCDATVTLIRRILYGEKFWSAHRSHCYQILSRRYKSHLVVTLGISGINVLWLFPWAYLAVKMPDQALVFASVAYAPLVLFILKSGAGIPKNNKEQHQE